MRSAAGLPTPNTICFRPEPVQLAARAVADILANSLQASADDRANASGDRPRRQVRDGRPIVEPGDPGRRCQRQRVRG